MVLWEPHVGSLGRWNQPEPTFVSPDWFRWIHLTGLRSNKDERDSIPLDPGMTFVSQKVTSPSQKRREKSLIETESPVTAGPLKLSKVTSDHSYTQLWQTGLHSG